MKAAIAFAAFLAGLLVASHGEAPDTLDRKVHPLHPYDSFHAAVQQIEAATGLKVSCPKDTAEATEAIWNSKKVTHSGWSGLDELPVKKLLDEACADLGLCWVLEPEGNTVRVDIPWRSPDPRPAADLLQLVWKPGEKDLNKDEKWRAAFDALLSKPENVEKALPVRQRAELEEIFRGESGGSRQSFFPPMQRITAVWMVTVSGQRYQCLLVVHPAQMSPGNGCLSYYWFEKDGTIAGAGLLSTGGNCTVDAMVVDKPKEPSPSQLRVTTKNYGLGGFTVLMELGDKGLQVKQFVDVGLENPLRTLGFGESMLETTP